ncbi:AbrB/MazE/SpoVT family DNA-binding domain-containing protein [bacterium]|nr:AbrB/MazE/SpoVT family DNA-binding domain-containing protein [bacterium]
MNTVTVRQRGEITLPKEIRDTCHLKPGVTLSVVPIDGVILLIPGHYLTIVPTPPLEECTK